MSATESIQPGDYLRLDATVSAQFAAQTEPLYLRVWEVLDRAETWPGWAWVEGNIIDAAGKSLGMRELYLNLSQATRVDPELAAVRHHATSRPPTKQVLSNMNRQPKTPPLTAPRNTRGHRRRPEPVTGS